MFLIKFYSLLILLILAHIETLIALFKSNLSYFVLAFFIFFFFSFVANIFKNYNYSKSSLFFLFSAFILNFINCFFIKYLLCFPLDYKQICVLFHFLSGHGWHICAAKSFNKHKFLVEQNC